jgi:hypothetical protein
MILPMIMEVADQKPIFFAREAADIMNKEDKEYLIFGSKHDNERS